MQDAIVQKLMAKSQSVSNLRKDVSKGMTQQGAVVIAKARKDIELGSRLHSKHMMGTTAVQCARM